MTESEKNPAKPKQSNTKDVAKAKDASDKSSKNKPANKSSKAVTATKSSNAGLITLIFFILIGAGGGLYLLWEEQQKNVFKQLISAQNFEQQVTNIKQQQAEFIEKNEEQITEIHSFQENLRNNLTNLIRNKQHLRNDWLMAEAEYLVQLANHRLLLEKDVATAAVALKAADARLAEVADPALLHVRKFWQMIYKH